MIEIVMSGLDGGNPLGFLAAIGTFRTLSDAMPGKVKMNWKQEKGGWRPCIAIDEADDAMADLWEFSGVLACLLGVPARLPADEMLHEVKQLEKSYRKIRGGLAESEKKLKIDAKEAGIKGREDVLQFIANSTDADRSEVRRQRQEWLSKLRRTVISPELGLGKTLAVMPEEMRVMATSAVGDSDAANRFVVDLISAFGSESSVVKNGFIEYTPFCFVTGSGQQFFLETIQKLMSCVSIQHIHKTLFATWAYDDLRFSLRWDPVDDRRYALMWGDPTAQGNEARTMWAANLIGYRGLSILPSFSVGAWLKTTGFNSDEQTFSWPIWVTPISLDVLRSLLASAALIRRPMDRKLLNAMGVNEIYQSTRIQVGTPPLVKTNFSQSVVA